MLPWLHYAVVCPASRRRITLMHSRFAVSLACGSVASLFSCTFPAYHVEDLSALAGLGGAISAGGAGQGASAGYPGGAGGIGGASEGGACNPDSAPEANCVCHTHDAHDYWFCFIPQDFAEAESRCAAKGMRLIQVSSAAEDGWIYSTAKTLSYGEYYLGTTDASSPDDWSWLAGGQFWTGLANGTAAAYVNWRGGEPNGSGDCAMVLEGQSPATLRIRAAGSAPLELMASQSPEKSVHGLGSSSVHRDPRIVGEDRGTAEGGVHRSPARIWAFEIASRLDGSLRFYCATSSTPNVPSSNGRPHAPAVRPSNTRTGCGAEIPAKSEK